jgi:hypothetical protein
LTITKSTGDNKITRVKKLKDLLKTDHLNVEERENLTELCTNYSHILFLEGDKLSATDVVTHSIKTPRCVNPINIRPYRLPWAYQQEIEKQITEIKNNKIIQNSVPSFNFPLVVVKKKETNKDGTLKLRICTFEN